MTDLTGIFSALLTPFDQEERIDPAATERLVGFQQTLGIQGLYVGGSSGEAMLQSREERAEYLHLVAQIAGGDLPLIAHVGANATSDTLVLAEHATKAGYRAISAISPYYYGFSRGEVMRHFRALADGAALPLIIYNFPARTQGLSTDELLELLTHPNIVGLKNTSPDFFQLEQVIRLRPDALVYNGADEMCLAGFAIGAHGAIGTTYNFMGDLFVAMRAAVEHSDIAEARSLQAIANEIIAVLLDVGVMPGSKVLLDIMGVDIGVSRPPFRRVTTDERDRLSRSARSLLDWRSGRS